jgi:hypothetical protein
MNTKVNISAPTPWKVTSPKYSRVSGKAMKLPKVNRGTAQQAGAKAKQAIKNATGSKQLTQSSLDKEMKVNKVFGAGLK